MVTRYQNVAMALDALDADYSFIVVAQDETTEDFLIGVLYLVYLKDNFTACVGDITLTGNDDEVEVDLLDIS